MYETLSLSSKDGVITLKLNRPEKLNALNPQMGEELLKAFNEIESSDARAIIMTGEGRAFCAGGDVQEDIAPLSGMNPAEFNKYFGEITKAYKKIFYLEKPVIAAVNGYAIGAGLDLAMSCDIRIASDKAQFGQFFVKMGLIPEVGLYLMPQLVGLGRAKLLSFTGDLIDAKEAEQIGLVDKVVSEDELMPFVEGLAKKLASGPPKTIGMIKKGINESLKMNLDTFVDSFVSLGQYQLAHTRDHKEAVTAYLEKRKPVFKGC